MIPEKEFFTITHKNGNPWISDELRQYAIDNTTLVYCDIVGFSIDEYGDIYLMDSCGNYAVAPDDCKLVWNERD